MCGGVCLVTVITFLAQCIVKIISCKHILKQGFAYNATLACSPTNLLPSTNLLDGIPG